MEIVVQLVSSLAWPITVLVIVFVFRSELAKAFSRLSNLKYKELEVKFGTDLEKVEKEAKLINLKTHIEVTTNTSAKLSVDSEYEQLIKIAELSPRAAITAAWFEIEKAAKEVITNAGLKLKRPENVIEVVNYLVKERLFNESAISVFNNLRRLRNEATHAPEFVLSISEAERFINLSLSLAHDLYSCANLLPSFTLEEVK